MPKLTTGNLLRRAVLLTEAATALAGARIQLQFRSFARLRRRRLERPARNLVFGGARRRHILAVRSAVLRAERLLPWTAVCFDRALACLSLLRRRGIEPQLHYGVLAGRSEVLDTAQPPLALHGHVWLTDGDSGIVGLRESRSYHKVATLTPEGSSRGTVVLVLGVPRSGTSAVAAGLAALGVDLGPRLRGPTAFNPTGLFEDAEVAAVNAELLRRVNRTAFSDRFPPGSQWQLPAFDDLRSIASALAVGRFGQSTVWGFKDPRTLQTLDFWISVLENAGYELRFVLALRHPSAVAASLESAFGLSHNRGLRLWLAGWAAALAAAAQRPLVCVDYDALVEEPSGEMLRLADRLGLSVDDRRLAALESYARLHIDRTLRHQGADNTGGRWGVLARYCYRVTRTLADRPRGRRMEFWASACRLLRSWQESLGTGGDPPAR